MKIICAGFWKTGTKSLASALAQLGYKVYDYDYQVFELKELWRKFADGTATDDDIRESLENVDALIDGPVIAYWEEIYRAIPDVKVILSIRDEDDWWRSYRNMMNGMPRTQKYLSFLAYLTPTGRQMMCPLARTGALCLGVDGIVAVPLLHFKNDPRMYKNVYRKHNSHVLHTVPNDKLLILEPRAGWKPLCNFLNEKEPDTPYPHKNKDGAHFTTEGGPSHPALKRFMTELLILLFILLFITSLSAYFLLRCVL